jgi:large subunit ribosomal protein L30
MAKIKITQIVSRIGSTERQKRNLAALGIKKTGRVVVHEDSPIILGMVEKVKHLVRVEPATEADIKAAAAKRIVVSAPAQAAGESAAAPAVSAAASAVSAKSPAGAASKAPSKSVPAAKKAAPKAASKAPAKKVEPVKEQ